MRSPRGLSPIADGSGRALTSALRFRASTSSGTRGGRRPLQRIERCRPHETSPHRNRRRLRECQYHRIPSAAWQTAPSGQSERPTTPCRPGASRPRETSSDRPCWSYPAHRSGNDVGMRRSAHRSSKAAYATSGMTMRSDSRIRGPCKVPVKRVFRWGQFGDSPGQRTEIQGSAEFENAVSPLESVSAAGSTPRRFRHSTRPVQCEGLAHGKPFDSSARGSPDERAEANGPERP